MSGGRKLSDAAVARMRAMAAEGWSRRQLAEEFNVSVQYVGRVLRGEQRAELPAPEARGEVGFALDEVFKDAEPRSGRTVVVAAVARLLARKIDATAAAESAAAANAAPKLAAQLLEALDRLALREEPDALDALRLRRDDRLQTTPNGSPNGSSWRGQEW
jgi:transcriptional regulator with XRE-family HTH domain